MGREFGENRGQFFLQRPENFRKPAAKSSSRRLKAAPDRKPGTVGRASSDGKRNTPLAWTRSIARISGDA
jgi:hypothetical protein